MDLELADGVTALVGRNGAGKSTFLEAMGWCLYGNAAARTGKELLKRRGANPSDDVRVHLAFRLGPHVYEVTRQLQGKGELPSATVKIDGKVVVASGAGSAEEATAYLERAFHMDREAFFTSIVARQRELAALSDATPAKRKQILVGLLRLDAVDTAIVNARTQRKEARAELAGLRTGMLDAAPLKLALDDVRKRIVLDVQRLVELDGGVKLLEEQLEDTRARRDSSRKVADEHRGILAELALLDQNLVFVRGEHARRSAELVRARAAGAEAQALAPQIEGIGAARERVEALNARAEQARMLVQVRAELVRALADVGLAQKELDEARASIAALASVRALAETVAPERLACEARVTSAAAQVVQLQTRAQETAKLINELSSKERKVRDLGPEAPCPTCTRPLHEHYDELLRGFATQGDALRAAVEHGRPMLDAARKEEAAARQALAMLTARETDLRAKLQKLAVDESKAQNAAAKLNDATSRVQRQRDQEAALASTPFDPKELDAARLALRAVEDAQRKHDRALAEAAREKELIPILAELAERERVLVATRAAADQRRAALAFDPAAHEAIERLCQGVEVKLTESRILREKTTGERLRKEDEEKRLVAQLAALEALTLRAKELERKVVLLEQLAGERDGGLLPEFKDHLIGRIRPLLSLHAGKLFRELCEGRYADLEVDGDYDLLVHDEGKAFPLERFSGGESDLANLCLRLAVSQVVSERAGSDGFSFLALDEIFGSQDDVRQANILRALAALAGRFRQILLITHIADVKESAEHVLRVEALGDGTSRIVAEG